MARAQSISWETTAPGRFERDLDLGEILMEIWGNTAAPYSKKEVLVHGVAKYRTKRPDILDAFKTAWITIRYRFPAMAAFVENGKSIYLQSEDLDTWLGETFIVISDSTAEETFSTSPPCVRPTLFVFPKSQEVMIQARHERIDGTGTLLFLNTLFDFVENPGEAVTFGDEDRNLSLPFDIVAGVPETPSPEAAAYVKKEIEEMITPHVGVPARNLDQRPSDFAAEDLILSEEETKAVLSGCKDSGFTVTQATHAAYLLATQVMAGKPGHCVALLPFALRRRCGQHAGDFSVVQTSGEGVCVPPGTFHQTADILKQRYLGLKPETYDLGRHRAVNEQFQIALQQPPPPEPDTSPELTSLGILENYMSETHGRVEILGFRQLLATVTPKIRSCLGTFRGRLFLTASYNNTFYSKEDVQNFLNTVKSELVKGLGISV